MRHLLMLRLRRSLVLRRSASHIRRPGCHWTLLLLHAHRTERIFIVAGMHASRRRSSVRRMRVWISMLSAQLLVVHGSRRWRHGRLRRWRRMVHGRHVRLLVRSSRSGRGQRRRRGHVHGRGHGRTDLLLLLRTWRGHVELLRTRRAVRTLMIRHAHSRTDLKPWRRVVALRGRGRTRHSPSHHSVLRST
jgi:hypothetical protein